MRPLKILMLASSYPKWPGEATAPFIEEIAAGLVRRGHCVHVALPYHPDLRRQPLERGIHLHIFRYAPHPALNIWGYAAALKGDIGLKSSALAAAPLALGASLWALLRLSAAAHDESQPFDLIHAHWVLPNGLPARIAAGLRHIPLVISVHGSDVYLAEKAAPLGWVASSIFRAAGGISACSGDLHRRAIQLGAPADRSMVLPYGVDTSAFHPDPQASAHVRAELGLAPETPLIVSVSRFVYKKGLNYLLEAMPMVLKRHGAAILVLAGYGDLREELERHAHELGVAAHVRFPGQLTREQVAGYIGAADVHVIPSIRDRGGNIDGLPNVLLEGMSAARPIVASAIAGIPDVITDRVHGLLVPEQDSTALADAISELLADPSFAAQLGAQARHRVLAELTWDVATQRFEDLYRLALGGIAD